jgi:NTE family protein
MDVSKNTLPKCLAIGLVLLLHSLSINYIWASGNTHEGTRPKLGLVLSGGGAKGFAHIGALQVFHEAGLQFDFVGGTSMGSIIGGLYAMGYHPDSMRALVEKQDWNALITDRIPRRYIPIEEKRNSERILIDFPIRGRKVFMRQGLNNGFLIDLFLSRLTSVAYRQTDFSKLPLPFLCIGTDLEDGSNVVLREGVLARAIRASISIPSFFTPVEINGQLLVDGGVINNFPVQEVIDMGADIIIGVDVQSGLHNRDELNSMIKVMDQVVSFYRIEANNDAVEMTDIYIKPDIDSFDIMSFMQYDSIITRGERSARSFMEELKNLADSLDNIAPRQPNVFDARPLDSIFISVTEFRGLQDVSRSYLMGLLNVRPRSYLQLDQLENAILQAYGSGFFAHISYFLLPDQDGARLVVEAKEASSGVIGAGVNYDTDYKVALLLNATFKNVLFKGSKLFLDLSLGENPRLSGIYQIDRGRKPGFGLGVSSLGLDFRQYEKGRVIESYAANHNKMNAYLLLTYKNSMQFRGGIEYEYSRFVKEISPDGNNDFVSYVSLFVDWNSDTYDRLSFARSGISYRLKAKYISTVNTMWAGNLMSNPLVLIASYGHAIPISPFSTLRTRLNIGTTLNNSLSPPQHWFLLGGQTTKIYFDGLIPFTGLRFIEKTGQFAFAANFGWQYELYPRFFITPKVDAGLVSDNFENALRAPDLLIGYGVSVGYDSFIGPVELSLMGSNNNSGLHTYINIGYTF